jgi:hypothetical protein
MNLNSWKLVLATVVIFLAGMITGGLLVQHLNRATLENTELAPGESVVRVAPPQVQAQVRMPEVPLPRLAERLSKEFVKRLDKSLRLTPEQHTAIAKIVADGQERNHAIWTNVAPQVAPQMRQVMQGVQREIREHLTPAQLKQFEELMKPAVPHQPSGTNTVSAHHNNKLTPEQQFQKMGEESRRSLTNAPSLTPPPPPTNAPGI